MTNHHHYDLDGKTVVVTGGARGIGRAIAEAFVSAGANVAIVDCRFDQAEETSRELAALAPNATLIEHWKEPEHHTAAKKAVENFLAKYTPGA